MKVDRRAGEKGKQLRQERRKELKRLRQETRQGQMLCKTNRRDRSRTVEYMDIDW